jgi:hypothetical protein
LGAKSKARRLAQAAAKALKTGKSQIADEYQYSVLMVCTESLAATDKLNAEQLVEQLHFYDSRATIESASKRGFYGLPCSRLCTARYKQFGKLD